MTTINLNALLSELDRLADDPLRKSESTHFAIGYLCALNSVRHWAVTHATYWPDSYQEAVNTREIHKIDNAGDVPRRGSDVGTSPLLGISSEGGRA